MRDCIKTQKNTNQILRNPLSAFAYNFSLKKKKISSRVLLKKKNKQKKQHGKRKRWQAATLQYPLCRFCFANNLPALCPFYCEFFVGNAFKLKRKKNILR
ncbi:hypothetical protein GDO86_004328 [Hymenochirus boettgeri]|uniref:Uncharacterized protein n=1 Tax=Hymenochirus boettgeri TaxID=247094 RepID=A0A8T2KAS1_9PIPI|nr:hypothetical protein GDO86_004328 [Hymenochirus boettgeri]